MGYEKWNNPNTYTYMVLDWFVLNILEATENWVPVFIFCDVLITLKILQHDWIYIKYLNDHGFWSISYRFI